MGRREQENRKRKAAAKSCQSLDTWVSKVQSTPDNSNLQRKLKKGSSYREFELSGVRVIGRSKKIAESKIKNSFYYTVNISITFNCRNIK